MEDFVLGFYTERDDRRFWGWGVRLGQWSSPQHPPIVAVHCYSTYGNQSIPRAVLQLTLNRTFDRVA